jgi:hypothetical protein
MAQKAGAEKPRTSTKNGNDTSADGARQKGRPENLQPVRSEAEAREKGRKGGKASGESRREKKLMSQIYADFLARKFDIEIDEKKISLTGEGLAAHAMKQVMAAGGSPAVSLMREIREATEGQKVELLGPINIGLPPKPEGAPDV